MTPTEYMNRVKESNSTAFDNHVKSLKILVVTNMYPSSEYPYYGIFVKQQVDSLKKNGILVDVFFINGRENRLQYFSSIISLYRKLRSGRYDIIHAHHTYCVYPILICRILTKTRIASVLTFHEGEVYKTRDTTSKKVGMIKRCVYLKSIKKIAANNVDLVIPVEERLMDKINFKGRTVVLPCGVDMDIFQPRNKTMCRKRLKLPLDKKILFFPAAPEPKGQKGYDIVREALRLTFRNDVVLVASRNIPHEDMPYYMCAADVIVQASQFEASPMVIKEAMACNVPVVSTDVGDVRKIIGDTEGCYVCRRDARDIADKIEKALVFNAATKGRERILSLGLGLEQVSAKIGKAYEELTGYQSEEDKN